MFAPLARMTDAHAHAHAHVHVECVLQGGRQRHTQQTHASG